MTDNRSIFSKWMDVISKICTILIPVVLFYLGNEIKKAQDADNKQQQINNRVSALLKSLSSDNPLERRYAITFSESLAKSGDFPNDLLAVIEEASSTDSAISKQAGNLLDSISQRAGSNKDASVQNQIKQLASNSPTKVYLQIPVGYDMKVAKTLFNDLKNEGYNMLGIEHVDLDKSPKNSEIRYFKKQDNVKANELSQSINKSGFPLPNVTFIPGYENRVSGSQLEIWLK